MDDTLLTMGGSVVVTSSTGGKVEFRACSGDLTQARAEIRVRFKIVDTNTKVAFCPSCEAETWIIRRM